VFKNTPIKATDVRYNREESKILVPDTYLEFVHTREGGKEQKMSCCGNWIGALRSRNFSGAGFGHTVYL